MDRAERKRLAEEVPPGEVQWLADLKEIDRRLADYAVGQRVLVKLALGTYGKPAASREQTP